MGDDGLGFGGDFGGTDGSIGGVGSIGDGIGSDGFGGVGATDGYGGTDTGFFGHESFHSEDPGSFEDNTTLGNLFGFSQPTLGSFNMSDSLSGALNDSQGFSGASFGAQGGFADGMGFGSDPGFMANLQSWLSTPIGKTLMGIISIANPALGAAMNIGKLGLAAANGKGGPAMGGALGGQIGSTLGSVAGPLGSMAGGMLGSSVGANALNGVSGQQGDIGGMQGQGGMGEALTSLAGLYAASRGGDSAKRQQQNLERLFTSDSPYAQQMRQRLERRDAAAGRRSQYGSREVELAAKLAELNARTAPQIQQLSQQRDQERNRKIAAGLMLAKNSGLFDGLGSMFGGGSGSNGAMF